MLSYIIILLITMFVDAFSTWSGMGQVALAATMAGFFFALADYSGWEASYNVPMIDAKKEYLESYRHYLNEVLDMANNDRAEVDEVIALLEPYRNTHESVVEVIDQIIELADVIDKAKAEATEGLEEYPIRMEELKKKQRKIQHCNRNEVIYSAMGFLVFFILIVFDGSAEQLMPIGSITTVGAFFIIMLTYFAKDILEDKAQKDVSQTKQLAHGMKEKLASYKEKLCEMNLMESAKKMISDIEKHLNKEEDVNNG